MHIPKWLIATAALLLVTLIAAIAFFVGRESSRPPAADIPASAAPQEVSAAKDPAPEEPRPPVAAPSSASAALVTPSVIDPSSSNTARPNAGAPGLAADNPPAAPEARARVAAYFAQMESIQSGRAGDPNEFATTIVNAAMSGDFSGIDDLVRAAGDAERRAVAIQPPSECADYHRQALTLLQDSRRMVTTLRDGLKRNDADALTSIGASAQGMKSRADNLAAAEKALRARFGL